MNLKDILSDYNINTVYDIGAYSGKWTMQYVDIIPNAVFYMFEANARKSRPAHLNLQHQWYNVLLSRDGSDVEFYYKNGTGDSYYRETDDTGAYANESKYDVQSRKTVMLPDFAQDHEIPYPELIKIDTQGSELDILSAGSNDIINHCKIVHCEIPAKGQIYNYGAPPHEDYMDYFEHNGFTKHFIEKDHVKKGVVVQHDMVFYK